MGDYREQVLQGLMLRWIDFRECMSRCREPKDCYLPQGVSPPFQRVPTKKSNYKEDQRKLRAATQKEQEDEAVHDAISTHH